MKPNEIGVCHVYNKGCDIPFSLHPTHYVPLRDAWMAGKTFYSATDLYGDEVVVKLADVNYVHHGTPERINQYQADLKDDKRAEAIE